MKTSFKTLALAAVSAAALLSQAANAAPSLSISQSSGSGTVSFEVSINNPEALLTAFNINLALGNLGSGEFQSINWGTMFGTLDADPACLSNLSASGCTFGPTFSGTDVMFGAFVFPNVFLGDPDEDDLKAWQNYDSGTPAYASSIMLAKLTFAADEQGSYGARVTNDACPNPSPQNPTATYVAGQTVGGGNDPANDKIIYPACAQAVPEPASLGLLGLGLLGTMVMRRRVAA